MICEHERIRYEDEALDYIFDVCQRDLRQTLNMLELTYRTYSKITIKNINKICDIPSQETLNDLLINITNRDVKEICTIIKKFQNQGYYSLDVLLHFIQYIKNNTEISEKQRISLINILSNSSYVMSKSSTNYIQLTGALLLCI